MSIRLLMANLLTVGLLVCSVWADTEQGGKPVCAEARSTGVKFGISMATDTLLAGEPVVATFTLTNETGMDIILPDPERLVWVVSFEVAQVSGDKAIPDRLELTIPGPPRDYGWSYRPGESRKRAYDLQQDFGGFLPVGRYEVKAIYRCDPKLYDGRVVRDITITTPGLEFSVISPSDPKGKAVLELYREAYGLRHGKAAQAYRSATIMHALSDPSWGGRLSQYAAYWEALALRSAGDKDGYLERLKQYTKDHADVPYYGQEALRSLASALAERGDVAAARAAYEKLPDSWERRSYLRRLETMQSAPAPKKAPSTPAKLK